MNKYDFSILLMQLCVLNMHGYNYTNKKALPCGCNINLKQMEINKFCSLERISVLVVLRAGLHLHLVCKYKKSWLYNKLDSI